MRSFQISDREAGQRLDKYLFRVLNAAPAGFVYKMLRKKNIVLNGSKAAGSEIIKTGDEVRFYLSEETFAKFAPAFLHSETGMMNAADKDSGLTGSSLDGDIEIVYEDEDILIINKPAGLLSQKAKPDDDSANDRIIAYLIRSGQITPEDLLTFHPSICNRLDRNTSGLLIAGKNIHGLQEMAELLRSRDLKKYYHALVAGRTVDACHLTGHLVKDEENNRVQIFEGSEKDGAAPEGADFIETVCRPVACYGNGTLLEICLITGRSHQIRAHLASIGSPILGDPKYGDKNINRAMFKGTGLKGQLLCASRMEFPDGRIFEIPDPESFVRAEEWLAGTAKKAAEDTE